jgi:transcription initiation factor TFIID subunit 5
MAQSMPHWQSMPQSADRKTFTTVYFTLHVVSYLFAFNIKLPGHCTSSFSICQFHVFAMDYYWSLQYRQWIADHLDFPQVLEYLNKKGYSKTEATLRRESAHHDDNGRPLIKRAEDAGGKQYDKAYGLLLTYVEDSLEVYRPELVRLLWPMFVHSVLSLAADFYPEDAKVFNDRYSPRFEREHPDEVRQLGTITLPEHLQVSHIAKIYRSNKYRLTMTTMAYSMLTQFLEARESDGGSVLMKLIEAHMHIVTVDRAVAGVERSLAAMLARKGDDYDMPGEDEGIPGHNPGSANTDRNAPNVLARLTLGPLEMDNDAMEDIRAELQDEDLRDPPKHGENSLVEEFEQRIKVEPDEGPTRDQVPLPPPIAREIAMEVQKIREHRDRFKIDPKTGGVGPGVSVCMYTFHNTHDR